MHLPPRPLKSYPLYLRPFFWIQKKKYGTILTPALLWARIPRLFGAVAFFYGTLERKSSPLSPVLRALLTVRVSQINHCSFCVDINSSLVLKRGAGEEKLNALKNWKDSPVFNEIEKIALEYTEAMTLSHQQIDQPLMEKTKKYFDENALIELTALIAFQNLSSKFNAALDVEPQGFCSLDK